MSQEYIFQQGGYGQYFITINGVQTLRIVNHYVVHLKLNIHQLHLSDNDKKTHDWKKKKEIKYGHVTHRDCKTQKASEDFISFSLSPSPLSRQLLNLSTGH